MYDKELQNIRSAIINKDLDSAEVQIQSYSDLLKPHPYFLVLKGLFLIFSEKIAIGKPLIEQTSQIKPESADWSSDLGLAFFLLGNIDKAKYYLELSITLPNPDAITFNRLGILQWSNDDHLPALENFRQAIMLSPDKSEFHNNLARATVLSGRLEEGLYHYENALKLDPEQPQAMAGRDAVLIAMQRSDVAILDYEKKLENDPSSINISIHLANLLENSGRFDEAYKILLQCIELNPDKIDIILFLANMLAERHKFIPCLWALNKAKILEPENQFVLSLLAKVYGETENFENARKEIEKLSELFPNAPSTLMARAEVNILQDNYNPAIKDMNAILDLLPNHFSALNLLGYTMMLTGDIDKAIEFFSRSAEINPAALTSLIETRQFPRDNTTIEKMVTFLNNPLLPKIPRASMSFALHMVYENKKNFYEAFSFAKQGNDLINSTINYSPAYYTDLVDQLIKVFDSNFFAEFKNSGFISPRPVFVVGMPRSGTTLTEQILCAHPHIFGAGELGYINALTFMLPGVVEDDRPYPLCLDKIMPWMLKDAGSYYLKKIYKFNDSLPRVVDKMPHNFLHLGLISLILPEAKIVHVIRDHRDVALSNYFTNFKNRFSGMGYAFDLKNIALMIADYRRIMKHWLSVLPSPIFQLEYEDLIENPESVTKALSDFVGVEWHEKMLDFHQKNRPVKTASVWQVRQPIYKSSRERWRNYERFLGPYLEIISSSCEY